MKYNPHDIKPILNPIDFIVFEGMNQGDSVNDIVFLSRILKNRSISSLRKQVKTVVKSKKYDWSVARIDMKGTINFE